jgi:hypothetical protein
MSVRGWNVETERSSASMSGFSQRFCAYSVRVRTTMADQVILVRGRPAGWVTDTFRETKISGTVKERVVRKFSGEVIGTMVM